MVGRRNGQESRAWASITVHFSLLFQHLQSTGWRNRKGKGLGVYAILLPHFIDVETEAQRGEDIAGSLSK
jgi:hypothetical protein